MKQDTYDVNIAPPLHGIISCKCVCNAGSQLFDEVVYIHTLPVLIQFLIFLLKILGNISWLSFATVVKPQHASICKNMLQTTKSIGVPEADLKCCLIFVWELRRGSRYLFLLEMINFALSGNIVISPQSLHWRRNLWSLWVQLLQRHHEKRKLPLQSLCQQALFHLTQALYF